MLALCSSLGEACKLEQLGKLLEVVCKFAVAPRTCDAPHSTFAAIKGTFCVAPPDFFGAP
jgi:hypothetical protein